MLRLTLALIALVALTSVTSMVALGMEATADDELFGNPFSDDLYVFANEKTPSSPLCGRVLLTSTLDKPESDWTLSAFEIRDGAARLTPLAETSDFDTPMLMVPIEIPTKTPSVAVLRVAFRTHGVCAGAKARLLGSGRETSFAMKQGEGEVIQEFDTPLAGVSGNATVVFIPGNDASCESWLISDLDISIECDSLKSVERPTRRWWCGSYQSSQNSWSCPGGSYKHGSCCSYCPKGWYCPGDEKANKCPTGKYGAYYAAKSCSNCPAGTYQDGGRTYPGSCYSCPAGKYSPSVSSSCRACPTDKYSPSKSSGCSNCPAAKYAKSDETGCANCPPGKARASGQTKCYDCAGGRYGYQYAQTSCRSCPKGKYRSGTGAKSSSQCTACNSGRFSAKLAAAYSSDCQGCEQGKYSAAGSSVCSLCAAGKYTKSSSSSSCESCPAGKISNSARKGCTDCAAGKYSNTGTDSSCRNCPVGYYCPGAKTRYACDAGKAQPSSTQSSCPACAAGRYAASKAASSCVQCSATKFQPLTGQSTCRPCYHTASSSTDFASCHCATGAVSKTGCFPFSIKYGCSKRDSIVTELQMTNTPAAYWKVKPRFDGDFGTEVMKSGKQSVSLTLAGYEPTLTQNLVNGVVHPGGQFDVWYNDFYSMVPFPCGCNTRPRVCAKVASRRRRRYYTTYSTSTKITPEQVDDAPRNIEVKQNRGLITFTWVVYSQCAVQYELTRKLVGSSDSAQIFTDLVHVPESEVVQSCNTKISPVNSFDDVRLSELQLGSTYSYCVTGTNIDYTSKVACKSHVVHFNSRVHVDVITMRGERPVEKAEVTWAIESAPSSCGASSSGKAAELTNKLGQTHFYMAPICLTASKYIVKVTVSKRTDGNPHIFKCADGSICDSIEIEVEHLNFDHKIVFRDASTAPVSGTVKVPFKVHKSVVVDTSTVERRDAKSARRSPSSTLGEGLEHTSVTFAVPDESSFVQRPLATEPVVDPAADSVEDDAEAIKLSARSSKAPTHISLPDTAFSGSSVVVSDAASANACQTECDGMTMCFGFSFLAVADVGGFKCRLQLSSTFKPVFSEGSTSTCSALHTDKTVCDQQGCIPGWTGLTCNTRTRHQKTFYSGSAIATTSTKATVDLCMSSCDSNSKCTAWSYQGTTCTHQLDKVWTHPGGIVYKNNAQSGCAKQFAKDISFSVICGQKAACKPGQMAPPNSAVCTERQLLTTSLMGTADLRAPAATAVVCAARCEAAQDECAAWTFCPSCVTDKKYPCQLYTQAKLTSDTLTRAHTKDAVSGCSTLGWSSRPHRCARCPTGFAGPQCADKVHHENAEPAYLTSALMGTAVADASTNWEACTAHCSSQTGCVAFTYRNNKCYVMAALDAKATETSFWARPGVTSGCSAYGFQLYGKMCTRKPIVATRFKNAVSIRASTLGAAKSSVACAEECDHDTACQAWTWNSKACYKDTSAAANLPAFQQLAPVKTQKAELLVNGTFVSVMPHSVSQVVGSPTGVAILNLDGTVATVMNGATSGTQVSGLTNVVALFSHPRYNYFVALRPDKSVRAWGSVTVPWTTADKALGVFMSKTSFAVIGDHGDANRVRVFSGTTGSVTHSIPHVVHIATTDDSYTAITLSGALHVFGVLSAPSGLPAVGFKKVVGTDSAFCAMHGDGRVFVFGSATRGGKLSADATGGLANRRATDIVATAGACAALCDDGSVYAWGDDTLGGAVPESKMIPLKSRNVKLHATEGAFIVLSSDGRVTVWGDQAHGDHVETLAANLARGIEGVLTTFNGFAAVTAAGGGASYVAASALVSSSAVGEIVSFASTDSNAYGVLRDGSLWASGTRPPPKTTHASRVVAWNTGVLVVSDTHVCYDPTGSGLLTNGPCVSDSHVSSCSQRSTAPSCTAAPCPFGSGGEKCSVSLLREGLLWYKAGTAAVAAVETAQECASKCEKTASCMGWSFLSDPGSGLEETCHHHTEVTSAWSAANGYTGVDVLANGAAVSACSSMWLAKKALTHGAASYKTRQAWCEKTKVTLVEHTLKTSTAVSTSLVEECVSLSAHACDLGCKTSASCKAWTHRGTVCHMFGGFSRILFDDGLGGEATSGVRQALAPKRECPTGRTGTQCEKHFLHHHTVYQAASGAAQITSNTVSGSAACAASCESHALCDWWTLTTANLCALWKANGGSFVVMHNINYRSACSRRYLNGVDLDQRMCWRQAPTPIVPVETMCALPRARVCVYNWFTGSLLLCEVTDATGKYEMHVPIDQAVFFVASFGKHKIELAAHASVLSGVFPGCASTVTTQRKYFVLGETGLFGVNFIDTTTNDVTITLAGGVPQCNAPLGSAEFLVLPRFACDQDDPLTLMHVADGTDDVTHRFTLPATLVDIKLNKVYERPEVAPYFDRVQSRMRNGVDLREFDEEDWEKSVTMDLSSGGGASPGSELSLSMCDKPVDDKTPPSGPVNKAQMAKILAAEAEAEKADAERYYRFEYHTRPNLNVVLKERVAGDAEFTEGDSDVKTSFNAKCAAAQKSFPVILGTGSGASVTPATTATFTITASEDYGDGNTCNFVDGSVQIVNRVGTTETVVFSEHDASGEAPASEEDSKKDASPQPADVAACAKPPGCTARLSVSKAVRGSPKPDNYLSVPEIVVTTIEAEPERNAAVSDPDTPHTKSFYATMNVPGWQTLSDINHIEMNIAVLGLVRLSAFFSLTLPEYLPVMILRDPPGGGSSASISGDKSVAYGNGASLEISGGLGVQGEVGITSGETLTLCVGLGVAVCKSGFDLDTEVTLGRREAELRRQARKITASSVKTGKQVLKKIQAEDEPGSIFGGTELGYGFNRATTAPTSNWEETRELSFGFAASTSGEPPNPGRGSDMYLVPSLSVKLTRSLDIKYNVDDCAVEAAPVVDLDPNGKKVLAWQTENDIRYRLLTDLLAQLAVEIKKDFDYEARLNLMNAINGWVSMLAYNGAVHHAAAQKGSEWAEFEEEIKVDKSSMTLSDSGVALDVLFSDHELSMSSRKLLKYSNAAKAYIEALKAWGTQNSKMFGAEQEDEKRPGLPPINTLRMQSGVKKFEGDEAVAYEDAQGLSPDGWTKNAGEGVDAASLDAHDWVEEEKDILEAATPNRREAPSLSDYHGVSFSGGGQTISYTVGGSYSKENSKSETWEHTITLPTLKFHFELQVGAGLDLDISIPSELKFVHGTSSSSAVGTSNEVSFELSDGDALDEFNVLIFWDPMFGTPVFHTISGRSMCVHEKNTAAREGARIQLVSWPTGPVMPGETAIFEILLIQDSSTGESSIYELDMPSDYNPYNLVPLVDGDTLIAPLVFNDFPSGSKRMTLNIDAGPELSKYPPFRLKFGSACEREMYFAGATSPDYSIIEGVIDIPVEWLEACPAVSFAGELVEEGSFVVNAATRKNGDWQGKHKDQLRVVAQNPAVVDQSWKTDGRLLAVDLEYRKEGTSTWKKATFKQSDETLEAPEKGGLQTLESSFGYATVYWNVATVPDGAYELRLHTTCSAASMENPPPTINEQFSAILKGVLDREAPQVFGRFAQPASGVYKPGSSISVTFTERIDCQQPSSYEVRATVTPPGKSAITLSTLGVNELQVICSGHSIHIEFGVAVPWDTLEGANVAMSVINVRDVAGNVKETASQWQFTLEGIDVNKAKASVTHVKLSRRLDSTVIDEEAKEHCAAAVRSELERMLGVRGGRVSVRVETVTRENEPIVSIDIGAPQGVHEASTAALLGKLNTMLWQGEKDFGKSNSTRPLSANLEHAGYDWLSRVNTAVRSRVQLMSEGAGAPLSGGSDGSSSGSLSNRNTLILVGVLVAGVLLVVLHSRYQSRRQAKLVLAALGSPKGSESVALLAESVL